MDTNANYAEQLKRASKIVWEVENSRDCPHAAALRLADLVIEMDNALTNGASPPAKFAEALSSEDMLQILRKRGAIVLFRDGERQCAEIKREVDESEVLYVIKCNRDNNVMAIKRIRMVVGTSLVDSKEILEKGLVVPLSSEKVSALHEEPSIVLNRQEAK